MQSERRTSYRSHLRRLLRSLGALVAALALAGGYLWLTTALPTPEQLRARAAFGNTRILDRRGKLLYQAPDPSGNRRQPLPLEQISLALRQATIAVEDAGFYENPGVDLRGIARAAWANARSGAVVAGGSTITQQLARNILLDPTLGQQRSLERKLREAILALKLTAAYPKDDILALYLNQTYYGGMAYGVEAAARHFFGKPARDLDLAESALLAGLPQAPSRYDPFRNRAAALARQSQVLDAMLRAGFITPAQAAAARAEPLRFTSAHPGCDKSPCAMRAPHFVTYVFGLLAEQLGPEAVARGGLTVTTTLDADLQAAAQAILRRHLALLAAPPGGGPDRRARNGAVVVLDPSNGAILAMVGSPNFEDASIQGQVNAALASRQPGSAIKPLTYATALERGWTPASAILDVPTTFATREGAPYAPENYDRAYHGPITLREALATSSNVAAVRVLDAIGVPALLELAARLGITTLREGQGRFGLALTLGGGEVTPLELTAAYAAFANGGRRVAPFAILGIGDRGSGIGDRGSEIGNEDRALLPLTPDPRPLTPDQALSPQIAYLITDILSDRYARMRAFGAQGPLNLERPAAVKTGTTSDWRDNWTVGYTPDRVVGVWVGNADGRPMEAISGVSGAGPVWHDVMLAAHRGLPPRPFTRPDGIVEVAICAEGGLLPSPACPATRLERFVAGTQPTRPDDTHLLVAVDPALGCRALAGYPPQRAISRTYWRVPPEADAWAVSVGLPQPPRQICPMPGAGAQAAPSDPGDHATLSSHAPPYDRLSDPAPALVAPAPGARFALSPTVPRERQRIELQARRGATSARLTIYVDGAPIATLDAPPYRVFWQLTPGSHRVRVEAQDAQGKIWRSPEVGFVVIEP